MLKLHALFGIIYWWSWLLERKGVENVVAIDIHYPQVVRLGQVSEDYRKTRVPYCFFTLSIDTS